MSIHRGGYVEPILIEIGLDDGDPPGSGHRPWRASRAALVAVFVVAVFVAYLALRHGSPAGDAAAPSTSVTYGSPVVPTGHACARAVHGPNGGTDMLVGVQVRNRLSTPVTLVGADTAPGPGSMIVKNAMLGACDVQHLSGAPMQPGRTLSRASSGLSSAASTVVLRHGEQAWYTVRLAIARGCPADVEVEFVVTYLLNGNLLPEDAGFVQARCSSGTGARSPTVNWQG